MNLANKYRPSTFEDVVGQKGPIQALKTILDRKDLKQQAYIFTGSRGTGKTTVARIFGKSLNCFEGPTSKPCGKCPACQAKDADIVELDAASNSSINDIRELKKFFYTRPMLGRYRIYILDEVHMLSPQAFDLLLKTLEEPPRHAIFIMATTELDKIPSTIRSRAHVYSFELLPVELIKKRLGVICNWECINASGEVLTALAEQGDGSMRDAITLLARFYDDCSDETVFESLGLASPELLQSLIQAVKKGDKKQVWDLLDSNNFQWVTLWYSFLKAFQNGLEYNWAGTSILPFASKLAAWKERTQDIVISSQPEIIIPLIITSEM